MRIANIVGARPNFMKIGPLMAAYAARGGIEALLVHTGQHYDEQMSELFFKQLGIAAADINLGVGSGSHAAQTAAIMAAFEPVVLDTKLIHVEAGLRSFDRSMPEEINRVLTDAISDLLFCTEQSGVDNLCREGIGADKIFLVGNVMIDTLLSNRDKAETSGVLDDLDLSVGDYAVLTLHRPSNVDDPAAFGRILDALDVIQRDMPIVFPVHPRTRKNLVQLSLIERIEAMPNLRLLEPIGYLDFLKLISSAKLALTDSGGIQEETTILKVPCLTLRENTERPITVQIGSNQIVGTDTGRIVSAYQQIVSGKWCQCGTPPLWDGHTAERIVEILRENL